MSEEKLRIHLIHLWEEGGQVDRMLCPIASLKDLVWCRGLKTSEKLSKIWEQRSYSISSQVKHGEEESPLNCLTLIVTQERGLEKNVEFNYTKLNQENVLPIRIDGFKLAT